MQILSKFSNLPGTYSNFKLSPSDTSEESSAAFEDSALLKAKQLSLPHYCLMILYRVLDFTCTQPTFSSSCNKFLVSKKYHIFNLKKTTSIFNKGKRYLT